MKETLTKVALPVVGLGIISFVVAVIVHLTAGVFLTVSSGAYLEFTQTCFLFAIAAGVLPKGSQ